MKGLKTTLMISVGLLLCSSPLFAEMHFGNYRTITLEKVEGKQDLGPRLSGEDCRWFPLFAEQPDGRIVLEQLVAKAPPGTTGFRNLSLEYVAGIPSFAYACVRISGIPVK